MPRQIESEPQTPRKQDFFNRIRQFRPFSRTRRDTRTCRTFIRLSAKAETTGLGTSRHCRWRSPTTASARIRRFPLDRNGGQIRATLAGLGRQQCAQRPLARPGADELRQFRPIKWIERGSSRMIGICGILNDPDENETRKCRLKVLFSGGFRRGLSPSLIMLRKSCFDLSDALALQCR